MALAALLAPASAAADPFLFLQAPFTQEVYGVAPSFLGGVAFAPNGDPWATRCQFSGSPLLRWDSSETTEVNSTEIHVRLPDVPSNAGCGLTNHPNGDLYSNTSQGVTRLDASTGVVLGGGFGPGGNALGIAPDPQTGRLIYVGSNGTLYWVTPALDAFGVFSTELTGHFLDGIYFDPSGEFLLVADRSPSFALSIIDRAGDLVQSVPMGSEPDGIAFRAVAPRFVVTNNLDGTMTRFDFPGDDLTQTPIQTLFASGGFRGDLSQVGPDGCLYITQNRTRYDDGTVTFENSLVRLCPGFAPPPGVGGDRNPLIFLHGITGAFLQDANGEEVWPDEFQTADLFDDPHLDVLKLQDDGITPDRPEDPKYQISVKTNQGIEGIIDLAQICIVGNVCYNIGDAYLATFEFFENEAGFTRGQDLFPFAFDWRLSAARNGERLLDEIDRLLALTGADQVNIMAHSQGGLVTRAALLNPRSIGKVDRVVTLGTPYLGATKSLGVLDYREPCQADPPIPVGCFLNRAKAQELATNWPGFLQLLPSLAFFDPYLSPIFRFIDDDGDGFSEGFLPFPVVRERLADRNLALVDQAFLFHAFLDFWNPADPEVDLMRIVGDGSGTILRILEFLEERCSGILWWRECKLEETFEFQMGNGDGTVPLHSADLHRPEFGFDFRGDSKNVYAAGVGHGDLPKNAGVLDFGLEFLFGAAVDPVPLRAPAGLAAKTSHNPISEDPTPLAGSELLVRGPLVGVVTDGAGGELGVVDAERGIELSTIPGSSFSTAPSSDSYFLTADGAYAGAWSADEAGEVGFTVRAYADDAIVLSASTPRFTVAAGAVLSLAFTQPLDVGSMAVVVDDDDDGSTDRLIPFLPPVTGGGAEDRIAPRSTIAVERYFEDGHWLADVVLTATDEGGAGVDRIEYALDASEATAVYAGPLTVPAHGEIYVRAIDRAGNVEAPHQVTVLDDHPSRIDLVDTFLTPHFNEAGYLEHGGDVDLWGLEVEAGRHKLQLIGLQGDYDLALLDADGAVVATSANRGRKSESITLHLDAGRYYLAVTGFAGAHSETADYRLNVNRLGK